MKITREDVRRVAILARLRLTAAEEDRLTAQLDSILHYMDKLNELDTVAIEPLAHVVDLVNAFRDDQVTNPPDPEALLANAPARDETFFQVPRIIE